MCAYPTNLGDEIVFREEFTTRKSIINNSGVITETTTLSDGMATFDGVSGNITYPVAIIPSSFKGTVAMDVVIESAAGTPVTFFSSADSGSTQSFFILGTDSSDRLFINQRDFGAQATVNGTAALTPGVKYRVVYASDGSVYTMFIDGVEDTVSSSGGNGDWLGDTTSRDNLVFGGLKRSSQAFYNVTVGNVIISTETWTAQEALDDYNGTTYPALDAAKALVYLPLKSHFSDGSNQQTKNLGTEGNLILGDGTTSTTFPTQLQPKGMSFDGGDYLETAGTVALAATDNFIFNCRFTADAVSDYILHWGTSALTEGIAIYTSAAGKIIAATADAGGVNEVESPLAYNDGIERCMTVTCNNVDASNVVVTIFVDGVSVISSTVDVPVAATQKIVIGSKADKSQGWDGNLKGIGLWKTTGTPRQARWLCERSVKELNI